MPSNSWIFWKTARALKLNEIRDAHKTIGGIGRGRRYATEQLIYAYTFLLASQFQGFCRDLHSECVDSLVKHVTPVDVQNVLNGELLRSRSLDQGNANPSNLGKDFNR